MNKSQLVAKIAANTDLTRRETEVMVQRLLDEIVDEVAHGHKVTLTGFGTFKRSRHQARNGVNPRNGEKLTIKARTFLRFVPSRTFKNLIG